MRVLTIIGTRPEIIRLSLIIKKLDELADQHILVHTGQNFSHTLNSVFFKELEIRKPDYTLCEQEQSFGQQMATTFHGIEKILQKEKPDKVLILGDTNSALSAIVCERMGIPVYHMEAGNRCFDLRVPEEKNRRIIDSISSFNLPYTKYSKENLVREGLPTNRIFLCGNPINEVLNHYQKKIEVSDILEKHQLHSGEYFLVTIHRAENVDHMDSLLEIFKGLNKIAETYQKRLICSLHPRTKSKMDDQKLKEFHPLIEFHEPFGFFDFVKLEKNASCVLTDSGTVQEECCIFHVPTVTVRNSTERQETVDCGSNIVSGVNSEYILNAVQVMLNQSNNWTCPEGYLDTNVSDRTIKLILGGAPC